MAKKRGPGRPRKRRSPQYKLGKACSLPGPLWEMWLQHVLDKGPTWLYVCLMLTHVLCCRVTEVLKLKKKDINFKRGTIFVAPLKRGPPVTKHVMKPAMAKLRLLRDRGVAKVRTRKKGMWGDVKELDRWKLPADKNDWLFPALRNDCDTGHTNKNTVCKAVARIRGSFNPQDLNVENNSIRSHSGRHRMVNDMKRCGVADGTAMRFARIIDRRTFLGYGELDDVQTGQAFCRATASSAKLWMRSMAVRKGRERENKTLVWQNQKKIVEVSLCMHQRTRFHLL